MSISRVESPGWRWSPGTLAGWYATVSDPDGDPLTLTLTRAPQHGTVTLDSRGLAFFYTPAADYAGPDSCAHHCATN